MGVSTGAFRKAFEMLCAELGLSGFNFRPYSLRRGGATNLFRSTGSVSKVIVRGRWASQRTARIYVLEGMGVLAEVNLSEPQRELFEWAARQLVALAQVLG